MNAVIDWFSDWWKVCLGGLAIVGAIVGIVLIIAGSTMDHGTITSKWHDDGHYYWSTQCTSIYNAATKTTQTNCFPVQYWDDEDWGFDLEDCMSEDSDCKRGSREVSETDYNAYEIGDFYDAR